MDLSLYFSSFLSQSGRRADKSHQLATNAAKPAKPSDKFNLGESAADQISGMHPTADQISNVKQRIVRN